MSFNRDVLFSSRNQAWATRQETFDGIKKIFNREYNLDPCAQDKTAKCENYITAEMDMFSIQNWAERFGLKKLSVFMNPEYGTKQASFIRELIHQLKLSGGVGDVLIPSRTDTALYHDLLVPYAERISYIRGRLTFGTDEYWEFVWGQETMVNINGRNEPNKLFGKVGRMQPAPFASMIVTFTDESVSRSAHDPEYKLITLPSCKYSGETKCV